jgi:hypothetical protein
MARTKKFKSVAGYLRSMGERIKYSNLPEEEEARWNAVHAGQRTAINNLLPQLGIPELIGPTEPPREGVERLLKLDGNEEQAAALETCRRWLKNFWVPVSSSVSTSTPADFRSGMIFRGEEFTPDETETIEAIQRERKMTMTEAIAASREGERQ